MDYPAGLSAPLAAPARAPACRRMEGRYKVFFGDEACYKSGQHGLGQGKGDAAKLALADSAAARWPSTCAVAGAPGRRCDRAGQPVASLDLNASIEEVLSAVLPAASHVAPVRCWLARSSPARGG